MVCLREQVVDVDVDGVSSVVMVVSRTLRLGSDIQESWWGPFAQPQ